MLYEKARIDEEIEGRNHSENCDDENPPEEICDNRIENGEIYSQYDDAGVVLEKQLEILNLIRSYSY